MRQIFTKNKQFDVMETRDHSKTGQVRKAKRVGIIYKKIIL